MAVNYSTVAEKIFRVLKGHGYSVQMFDDQDGNEISNPQEARFFYVDQPNLMVNLSPENEEVKMHKGPENIANIEKTVQSVKNLAKDNLLDFDLREFGREIKPKNYAFRLNSNTMSDENIQTESYSQMAGTVKTSSQKLEGAKLLIKHRKAVNEEIPGARSRNIKALYIENAEGERFKYPFIHLNGARAMTRHVQAGGNPFDEVGQSITNISERLSKIREVLNIIRRSPAIQEQAASVVTSLNYNQDRLRETIKKLMTGVGYDAYVENYAKAETKEYDQDTLDSMKEKFTVTNIENKITDLLPMIQEIHDEEINDTDSLRKRVQAKLNEPVEMHPPSDSQKAYGSDIVKYKTTADAIRHRIGELAQLVKDDEISVFLSRMHDKLTGADDEPMSKEDVSTVRAILDKVKKDEPKAVANAESTEVKEVAELTETFNRILGVFNPDQINEEPGDYKTVMSYTGKDAMAPMSYDAWLKKEKGIEKGAAGIKADQHIKLGKEYRDLKKADKITWKGESVEETKGKDHDKDGDIDSNDYLAARDKAIKKAMGKDVDESAMRDYGKFFDMHFKAQTKYQDEGDYEASPEFQQIVNQHPLFKDKENTKEDMTQADLDAERFADMNDFEEYRDAMMATIEDPEGYYKGKSTEEIAQAIRDEAKSIGYAEITDGERHPSEAAWLEKIADELDGSASEEVEVPSSGMDAPTPDDGETVAPTDLNKVILRIKDLAGIK